MRCFLPLGIVATVLVGCASDPAPAPPRDPNQPRTIPEIGRCDAGYQPACAELGLRYTRGDGVPQDLARASQLLEGACAANVARGCGILAGRLVAESQYERAFSLAERACNGGDGVGCHHLAGMYERGLGGTTRNVARALELYRKACEGKIDQGCFVAASIEERGAAGAVEDAQAAAHYATACKAEIPSACPAQARLLAFGVGVSRDLAAAREVAGKACMTGDTVGCGTIGLLTLDSTPADTNALAQVERACADGHRAFCLDLVRLMKSGRASGDEVRQRTLLRQACDAGWKSGCDQLVAPQ